MKQTSLLLIAFSTALLLPATAQAGTSAAQCIAVYKEGDKTYFENRCQQKVTVAMCSRDRKINGKRCGEQKSTWNPYYNQMFVLDPGERQYKWKAGQVEYAACLGFINAWDAKGKFSSTRSGSYGCHN